MVRKEKRAAIGVECACVILIAKLNALIKKTLTRENKEHEASRCSLPKKQIEVCMHSLVNRGSRVVKCYANEEKCTHSHSQMTFVVMTIHR